MQTVTSYILRLTAASGFFFKLSLDLFAVPPACAPRVATTSKRPNTHDEANPAQENRKGSLVKQLAYDSITTNSGGPLR